MKKTNKIIAGVVILILAGIFIFANTTKTTSSELKIGAVLSITGYGAADSENIKRGMELAKEELAKSGTIVSFDYQDDKTDPKETVNAVRAVMTKNPDAIIGPVWSYLVDAGAKSLEDSKIATFSPSVTSEYVAPHSNTIFHGAVKNSQAIDGIAKRLEENNVKSVAIITTNGAWGDSLLSVFKESSKKASASVLVDEKVNFGDEITPTPTLVTKIKSSGAQAILWTGSEEGAVALIKRMNEQGVNIPIIGTNALEIVVKKGAVSKGNIKMYFTDSYKSAEFTAKFKAKYGMEDGSYAKEAYDGVMLLAEAKKNKSSNESIADYMRSKTNYSGYAGTYTFDSKGDRVGGEWIMTEIK